MLNLKIKNIYKIIFINIKMSQLFYRVSNRALFINLVKALNNSGINYLIDFSTITDKKNLTILDDTETDIYIWNTEFDILKLHNLLKDFEYTGTNTYITVYNNLASINIYLLLITDHDNIKLKDMYVPKSLINKTETINIKLYEENLKIIRSVNWAEVLKYKENNKKRWWQLW
jgi:hypothetical protein